MEIDKELYKEFIEGNDEALNELIIMYRNELIYFIYKFVKDFHAAEDVSQEVFVYLLQHKEIYDFKYSFRGYLYTIARSRALNYLKSRRRIVFLEDNVEYLFSEISDIEEELFKKEENAKVKKAIKNLKQEYQIVIYLVDFRRMSYEETGAIMGKSLSQVKALAHNARKRLKVFLEKEMGGEHDEVDGKIHY